MSLARPGSWKKGALNAAEFDAWDYAMRRRLGFFAGLRFFTKQDYGRTLVSRHWPHKLCWDWFLSWSWWRNAEYDGPRRFKVWWPAYGNFGVSLWFGTLRLSWQDDGWMPCVGPLREGAPKIIWLHHIQQERADAPALH